MSTVTAFKMLIQYAKNPIPDELNLAILAAVNTGWYPRDVLERAACGYLYEVTLVDGTHYDPPSPKGVSFGGQQQGGTPPVPPLTEDYIVVTVDTSGDIPNQVLRQWLHNAFAETSPSSPTAFDDEFDDTSGSSGPSNGLDSKWSWMNQSTSVVDFAEFGYGRVTPPASSTANARGLVQPIPAGVDYTFEAKFSLQGRTADYSQAGLILWDSVHGDNYQAYIDARNDAHPSLTLDVAKFANLQGGSYASQIPGGFPSGWWASNTAYMRIIYAHTSPTFTVWVSHDGIGWLRVVSFADTVTPDHIGIYANDLTNSGQSAILCDYFRRTA